jgi:predicted transcriptional regulator
MDVMTTNVITVDPDMSVQAVAQLLSERGISGVPVVDAANRLVGVVGGNYYGGSSGASTSRNKDRTGTFATTRHFRL